MTAARDSGLVTDATSRARLSKVSAQVARDLEGALSREIEGEVRFDAGSRGLYAMDASNYRHVPVGVVIPRSGADVVRTVALCREHGVPVLSRGGGTSLAGQCCNVAVVIDWSKYVNGIVELNAGERVARVQPGIVLDHLRQQAERHGLTFGPDPATHSRCTLGGMLGNDSCGVHSVMAGRTVDNTEGLKVLTYDGLQFDLGWMNEDELEAAGRQEGRAGEIFRRIRALRDRYANLIRQRYPDIPRRVSGYNLDELLPKPDGRFNLARALVGSEGTLATILEAKLRLVHSPHYRTLTIIGYPDLYQAAASVPRLLEFDPIGLEGMDHRLIENIQKKKLYEEYLPLLPEGKAWLLVEFGEDSKEGANHQAEELRSRLGGSPKAPHIKIYEDRKQQSHVWEVRESGLGATAFVPGEPDAWPGWEDSAVHPHKLADYLRDLCGLYDKHGLKGAMYGHFGQGCVHSRITFDLVSTKGVGIFRSFLEEAADLVVRYGGSLSGEHGDGQQRAELLERMYGQDLVEAFREFKSIWDPEWKMNPGKVVEPRRLDEDLRLGPDYKPWEPLTHFQFPDDGGSFAHATLRCVGVGKCRRTEVSTFEAMCPSYLVTREEMHTTRGRAHLLWEMLQGDPVEGGWRDEHVKEALDLCLACKGCKGDCPVNVDLATYKAEFLSHYWEGRMRPRHAYAFGLVDQWARLASLAPGLVNLVTQTPGLSTLAKLAAGIPRERTIPAFAPQTFRSWFHAPNGKRAGSGSRGRVILWADTFNNYFFPSTARAALEVLEDAGFAVHVPQRHLCCGRPLYDYGMLDTAKAYLQKVLRALAPEIEAGTPVVVLEPSCASVFREEMCNLFPHDELALRLKQQVYLLDEFLTQRAADYQLPRLDRKALVHGHCHHKSVLKFDQETSVLDRLGLEYQPLASGCCGMAGSFGFEKEKYEVSVAAGEHVLLPAVRKAPLSSVIVADGFSCREQISQLTGRHALHLAEVIQLAKDRQRAPAMYPEAQVVEQREQEVRRSIRRAGLVLAALGVAALGLLAWCWNGR